MLRGFDPLKENYHWRLILTVLAGEAVLVSFLASPIVNSALINDYGAFGFWIGLILFFLLFGVGIPLVSFIYSQREKKRRDALRRAILRGENCPLMPVQPDVATGELPLPLRIEVHRVSVCG